MAGSSCRAGIGRCSPTQGNCGAGSPRHGNSGGGYWLALVVEVEVGKRSPRSTSMHGVCHYGGGLSDISIAEYILDVIGRE